MVFARAEPNNHVLLGRNVRWLQKTQFTAPRLEGAWSYPDGPGDNSNSQFALLALYEAERAGVPVNPHVWRRAEAYWKNCQNPDGSWGYHAGLWGTGSMTAAGITSLVITADRIGPADATVEGSRIQGCQQAVVDNDRIQRALQWLGNNFSVARNPGPQPTLWVLYYLYGLERVGRFTAQRFIGGADWYRQGAEEVIRMKGGPLTDHWQNVHALEGDERVATAFALLFLAKGRWPVLVSKVKHSPGNDWNQHRHDIANLTHFVESRWQKDLVWQVVDLDAASVDDLTQSPVLYYCGMNSPLPDEPGGQEELAHKLRDYLDRGGFIFAEGYCGGAGFNQGFRKLMKLVFPEPEYDLRPLPPEHPIWHMEEPVDPDHTRLLLGIEYGCRTSVVYCPQDTSDKLLPPLSAVWEVSRPGRDEKYSKEVQAQIKAGLTIGLNVMAYATNRELAGKEEKLFRPPEAKLSKDPIARGKLYIANLHHPGGCNVAPRDHEPAAGGGEESQAPREHRAAGDRHHRSRLIRLLSGLHARPQRLSSDRRGAEATENLRRAGRGDPGGLDLREQAVHRLLPPGNAEDLSEVASSGDPQRLPNAHDEVPRLRCDNSLASRPAGAGAASR